MQEAISKRQEARGKRQEARGQQERKTKTTGKRKVAHPTCKIGAMFSHDSFLFFAYCTDRLHITLNVRFTHGGKRQEARGKRQKTTDKRQEARDKRQLARGKRQEARGKRQEAPL